MYTGIKALCIVTIGIIACMGTIWSRADASYMGFSITLEPQWIDLDHGEKKSTDFGGKWILAGTITFKKRIPEYVSINRLDLRWHGAHQEKLPELTGSLYHKNAYKSFIPIEEFLLCDGIWNGKEQVLQFPFIQQCPLSTYDVFYLVLTIPDTVEPIIKEGSFSIVENKLPESVQMALGKDPLVLSFKQIKTEHLLISSLHQK